MSQEQPVTAQNAAHPTLEFRYTNFSDGVALKTWLMHPSVKNAFSMADEVEVDDAVNRWISFCRYKCSLTAILNGMPCGIATLYLQPYKRLAHQCEFGIIVGHEYRGTGVGSQLLNHLIHLAKVQFHIEILHLQACAGNAAIRLYERFGFKEFGSQREWIKEDDGTYSGRVFMEKYLTEG